MKKLLWALLCAALALGAWARAEAPDAQVWTSPYIMDDFYYHATARCRLAQGEEEAPRGRAEAEAAGKWPCPACCPDETDYTAMDGVETGPLECFERGGTLVLRVSEYAIRARMSGASEPAAVPEALLHENANPADDVARLVHGEDYCRWLESAAPGTEQALTAFIPDVDAEKTDALLMSRRHIGAAWVLVIRPSEADRAALKNGRYYHLPMVFWEADLRVSTYEAGSLIAQGDGSRRWAGDVGLLPQPSGGNVTFRWDAKDGADYPIYVVRDGGVNAAVIRVPHYREWDLNGRLPYCGQTTSLSGYVDGKDVVYVCALTDGEVRALEEKLHFDVLTELLEEEETLYPDDVRADGAALATDYAPVTRVTWPDGTVAEMDQAAYPVGTGFVSCTLTRPEGGVAWYANHLPLQRLEGDRWKDVDTLVAYADGDEARCHEGWFCDHVSLTMPLEGVGALEEGLYRLRVWEEYGDDETRHRYLEFRVAADAPAPKKPEKREFGKEFLMVFDHTPPHADAETYNSCMDTTRVYEGSARTRLLAGDMVFELLGVDVGWSWGLCSNYSLFAWPEGRPEQARQLLANFDHGDVTLYDLGDGLLLFAGDRGTLYRCDYDGGNLTELGRAKDDGNDDGYIYGLVPVSGGVYMIQDSGVWYAALDGFDPKPVYEAEHEIRDGGSAIYAGGKLILADKTGIFALDALHPNADGTLPAARLTDEYDADSGENGFGYIVLDGRLYYWSESKKAMISMNLDGAGMQEVSKERYWFAGVTPGGVVLALSGSDEGMFGDERTAAAFYFPPNPDAPAFDPDHCEKRAIDPDTFEYVLGDYVYRRDEDGNETRMPLVEMTAE